jgi:NUMOD3 motif
VEEHWYNHYFDKGYAMYDIKIGAKHSRNTRQRMAEIRHNNHKFDYSSEEFKHRMSEKTSGENNGMYNKKDGAAVNGRMVVAYDQEGNISHEFISVKVALQFLNVIGHTTLNRACRTGELYKGFHWKKEWINR